MMKSSSVLLLTSLLFLPLFAHNPPKEMQGSHSVIIDQPQVDECTSQDGSCHAVDKKDDHTAGDTDPGAHHTADDDAEEGDEDAHALSDDDLNADVDGWSSR